MKSFAVDDIKSRRKSSLENNPYWGKVLDDSAVDAFLTATAEDSSELARYGEYLLRESRWRLSKNIKSLLTQAAYLGYDPHRKISAVGEVCISHDAQLQNAGVSFFESQLETLSPYTGSQKVIPIGTRVSTGKGVEAITSSEVTYAPGDKYKIIPVIQGIQKSFRTSSGALGVPFETLRILGSDIEAAVDSVSSKFLQVWVYLSEDLQSTPVQFTRVDDIYLADFEDYAYDVTTSDDFNYITIRFGNGIAGRILPKGSVVEVKYLSTLGSAGNVEQRYSITKLITAISTTTAFYVTNFKSIYGGQAEADIETIRGEAPNQYLIDGSIIVEDAYKAAIEALPFIYRAVVYSGVYTDPITSVVKDAIFYSAVSQLGDTPDSALTESALLERTVGKKSPLDILIFQNPEYLQLHLNIYAKTTSKDVDILKIQADIGDSLYDKYNIFKTSFGQPFDFSEFVSFIRSTSTSIKNVSAFTEAVISLKPSEFQQSQTITHYYHDFVFDSSFQKLKLFDNGVLHILKIQVLFTCAACEDKSRTLFLVKNEDYDPLDPSSSIYTLKQYPYISDITSYDYMSAYVLNPLTPPLEITPLKDGTPNPDYILFEVAFDTTNTPTNLGAGYLAIPSLMPNGTETYVNFGTADKAALDETLSIQVLAEPLYQDMNPDKPNNITKIGEQDISIEVSHV